jgi:2-methylcitrate dehydratase
MSLGFDHTTQLAMSIAVGVAKALGLNAAQTANALAIAASDFASLAVIRSSPTSQWKGLASSALALSATNSTFLAARGITGPRAVFEGPRGWFEVVGKKIKANWNDQRLGAMERVSLKKYNAEVHTQTALDALLELVQAHHIKGEQVRSIGFETVHATYDIVGGGAYGERKVVESKEQADHSLPYLAAVAVLDGEVWPEQFESERIKRADVQELLKRVTVRPRSRLRGPRKLVERIDPYTRVYPEHMPVKVTIRLRNGRELSLEKHSYEGFHDAPMSWDAVIAKFNRLSVGVTTDVQREQIVEVVRQLDKRELDDLMRVLRLERAPTAIKVVADEPAKEAEPASRPRRRLIGRSKTKAR